MHGDYVDRAIFKDTYLYLFNANTYDEQNDLIIDICVSHSDTLQAHDNNLLPSKRVHISERDVKHK